MSPNDATYISLSEQLNAAVGDAFARAGLERSYGQVVVSNRPDLCQFQCNGALIAARVRNANPIELADEIARHLDKNVFQTITVAGPGFLNLDVADEALADKVARLPLDSWSQAVPPAKRSSVIIDYGGPNVAKPLHVGHLRSAILGESIARIGRFLGHSVTGDVHLGDWGLQIGMVISELARRKPDLPYFDPTRTNGCPATPPLTAEDLDEIYPAAAARAKTDPEVMEAARQATFELQQGRPGYVALWKQIVSVSIADLQASYTKLDVNFDLWLGESDADVAIPKVLEIAERSGLSYMSDGALVIDVAEPSDSTPPPPLLLRKADGAFLYGTTDLATILLRAQNEPPYDLYLYVVDNRQSMHLLQVFRVARKLHLVDSNVSLEHIGFGTMNGTDGKPFKTRAGGIMKLKDLINLINDKALKRLNEAHIAEDYPEVEKLQIAHLVGIAMLKFADFSNARNRDYIFDIDKFSSFEGRTGPYLLYTTVRAQSILRRAADASITPGELLPGHSPSMRNLYLALAQFGDALNKAWDKRAPSDLCEYAYTLATAFSAFYRDHHILRETDPRLQRSYLALTERTFQVLHIALHLLGIETPERM